jgi:hypothetical protein
VSCLGFKIARKASSEILSAFRGSQVATATAGAFFCFAAAHLIMEPEFFFNKNESRFYKYSKLEFCVFV